MVDGWVGVNTLGMLGAQILFSIRDPGRWFFLDIPAGSAGWSRDNT